MIKKHSIALIMVSILLFACQPPYIENKFKVTSFELTPTPDHLQLNLAINVNYYADSTVSSYFSGGREKGLSGSNEKLIFFGSIASSIDIENNSCEQDFKSFQANLNQNERTHTGARFDRPYSLCNPYGIEIPNDLIMIFYDSLNKQYDTLYNKNYRTEALQLINEEKVYLGFDSLNFTEQLSYGENKLFKSESRAKCNNWKPQLKSFSNILKEMQSTTVEEWNARCYFYGCWYASTVGNSNTEYEINISPASHITLSNQDTTMYFFTDQKLNAFLIPCNCCEADNETGTQ